MRTPSRLIALALALGVSVAGFAWATAPTERASVEAALADLEKNPQTRAEAADAIGRARDALERSARMHAAGDEAHARLALALAHDWTEVAKEQARAADLERRAASERQAATDAGALLSHERAMLEQRVAENGRVGSEVSRIESADAGAADAAARPAPKAPALRPAPAPKTGAKGGAK